MKDNLNPTGTSDILDFLDNINISKGLNNPDKSDIVDVVKYFYSSQEFNHSVKLSEKDKQGNDLKASSCNTLSRMSTMTDIVQETTNQQELDLDKYQYLFDERAGILEHEALPIQMDRSLAESEAKKEITDLYAKEKQIPVNSQQVTNFIDQIIINLN